MKKIIIILSALFSVVCLSGCAEKVDKTMTWPEWASRPSINNLKVTALDGSPFIVAGGTVRITAETEDTFNDLSRYQVEILYNGVSVAQFEENLSGSSASISRDFEMPFSANLSPEEFYPEISITISNVAGGQRSTRVSNENNVKVGRPAKPAMLYLVGSGSSIQLLPEDGSFNFNAEGGTDFSVLGQSFYVAEKVAAGAPDYSGHVWGFKDGSISVVKENEGTEIPMPEDGGYGFKEMGFSIYSFKIIKLVNFKYVVDMSTMLDQEQNNVKYKALENVKLYRDCEVEFVGFPDISGILQPDRWEIRSASVAKFTAQTSSWGIYYDIDDNWLIMNEFPWNVPNQVWVTGLKACFPLGNNSTEHSFKYLDGDGKSHIASFSAVLGEDGLFRCLVYLQDDFVIQLYRWVAWASVVSMNSLTPGIAKLTDDTQYLLPGDDFTVGVYMITIAFTEPGNAGGQGAKADVSIDKYIL